MNTLGDRLRGLRVEKELEQKQLADILKVHKGTISNWENNKRSPDNEMLFKIANYFEVSTDYLLCKSNVRKVDEELLKKVQDLIELLKKNGISPTEIDLDKFEKILKVYKELNSK